MSTTDESNTTITSVKEPNWERVSININNTQSQVNPPPLQYPGGNSITLSRIMGYIVGGMLYLAAFGMLTAHNVLSAILVALAASMVFPPAYAAWSRKFNIHLSYWARVALFFTFMFLMGMADKK